MRGYYGLVREYTIVSHGRILWSIDRGYYLLCIGWQVRGVECSVRGVFRCGWDGLGQGPSGCKQMQDRPQVNTV